MSGLCVRAAVDRAINESVGSYRSAGLISALAVGRMNVMDNIHSTNSRAASMSPQWLLSRAMAITHALEVSVDPGLTFDGLDRTELWELSRAIQRSLDEAYELVQ